jgi:ankyrin repeat protein
LNLNGYDLINAAYDGDIDTVKRCLEQRVSVKCRSNNGFTALQWACLRGMVTDHQVEIVRLLLDAGCDSNSIQFKDGDSILMTACVAGNAAITRLLVEAGADVNAMASGTYPLIQAVKTGEAETIKILLKHGANKDLRDVTGHSALDHALAQERPEIIRLLTRD